MEALTIVAGSLLFGLIFLLASERQLSNSRKHRTHHHEDEPLPLDKSRHFSDDSYSDIFYPKKKRKSSKIKKVPDIDFENAFLDDDFPIFQRKNSNSRERRSRKGNPLNSLINLLAIAILGYLLIKYFSIA